MSEPNEQRVTTADLAGSSAPASTGQSTEQGDQKGPRDDAGYTGVAESTPLFPDNDRTGYQERWTRVQTRFVDEPQESVKEADTLVAEVMQQLAQRFAQERERMEKQWHSGSDVSTEDLRQALQSYRSFFQRLLSA